MALDNLIKQGIVGYLMYSGRIWDKQKNDWLKKHAEESPALLYSLFCEAFPGVKTTQTGVTNQRSRIGACARHNPNKKSRQARPLYSEQIRKGYVFIKIAQPNVWISKSKWVWIESHPWLYHTVQKRDNFIFIDGDKRNFKPSNIVKVSIRQMAILNTDGKLPIGNKDLVLFRVAKSKLKLAIFDRAEKLNMCIKIKDSPKKRGYRRLKDDVNSYARRYMYKRSVKGFIDKE